MPARRISCGSMAVLLLALTLLTAPLTGLAGCAVGPGAGGVASLAEVTKRAKAFRFQTYLAELEGRTPITVENPRVMAALRRYADEAKPVPPPDESLTWTRYSLSFQLRSGRWTRHRYLFSSRWIPVPAYIETTAGWFELSDRFNALIAALEAYPDASPKVDADDEAFLRQHGRTALFSVGAFDVTIPSALKHRAGEYPVPIYWAYHNELSKSVGLDLTPFLGRTVQVRLYKTLEPLPKAAGGHRDLGRAVIIRHDDRIVGAWMQYYGLSCSVAGRWFDEVAGSWDAWIPSLIDPDDPKEKALASLAPEELIRSYYLALERRDFAAASSYLSRKELMKALFSSDSSQLAELYSPGFPADFPWDVASHENTISAKVVAVRRLADLEVGRFQGSLVYRAELDLKVKRIITIDSGRHSLYFFLVRETPTTGWRINGQGPGEQPLSPWEATGP